MNPIQHANAFEDIQAVCREYRRQLKTQANASISDHLDRVEQSARQMLFQNLLHIDIEFRRRRGENLSSQKYIQEFPEHATLIRQAFFESTLMSQDASQDTSAGAETVTLNLPAARRIGDYELLRELGRGGFGVVYEARHLRRADRVALKTLPMVLDGRPESSRDAERLHRFRREFRSLSEINHPNLAGMQTLEVDGNQWFITMDLIEGVDFLEYVRPGGSFDETRLRAAIKQLARGVIALHERGIVHRDLKPSNVLVHTDGHVTILDFGLVAELQQFVEQTLSIGTQHFAGTPRYAAPEQISGQRTAAIDWYAAGTMLYEAVTGNPPFTKSGVELLVEKQTTAAPALATDDKVPKDLAELIDALLRQDPEQRPTDAGLAESLGIESDSLSHESTGSPLSSDDTSDSRTDRKELLVGREEQLAELRSQFEQVTQTRTPRVSSLIGRSGEGKTTLANSFLDSIRRDPATAVFAGRCYDRESVPFKAIDCLIDPLVAYLRSRSSEEVTSLLPSDIGFLSRLFPVLRRVESVADRAVIDSNIDARLVRYRAFAALRELLTNIAQDRWVVLFIDDLQWGDADSGTAMHELLRGSDAPPVMMLGSYRSDEADDSGFLNEWRELQSEKEVPVEETRVEIESLTEEQTLRFFAVKLGISPEVIKKQAGKAFEETRGNLYFLEQLIEGFDKRTGEFQAIPLIDIIARKLSRLPPEARSLLDAVAVFGQAVQVDEAAFVAGGKANAFATLTHMRSERLVRLIGTAGSHWVDTYHDKIRETVLETMEPSERKRLHLEFGQKIEASESLNAEQVLGFLNQDASERHDYPFSVARVFDLAYHFREAHDSRSFVYQMLAGELSHQAYAADDTVDYLERANAVMPEDASEAMLFRYYDRLAAAKTRLKETEHGLVLSLRALTHAASDLNHAQTHFRLGDLACTRGEYSESVDEYEAALSALGKPRPSVLVAAARIPFLFLSVLLLPRRNWTDQEDSDSPKVALEESVHCSLAYTVYEHPTLDVVYFPLRAASLAKRSGNRSRYATRVSFLAGQLALSGFHRIGKYLLRRVESISDQLIDFESRGEFLKMHGSTYAMSGEYKLAEENLRASMPFYEQCGLLVPLSVAVHLLRHLHQVAGSSSKETEVARQVLEVGEAIGDPRATCWGHYDIASGLSRAGQFDEANTQIDKAQAIVDQHELRTTKSIFLSTKSFVELQQSEYELAAEAARESWQLTKEIRLFFEYNARSGPQLLECLAGADWISSSDNATISTRLHWEVKLVSWLYINLRPLSLRVSGRAYWKAGKRKKAIRFFERAVRAAENLAAGYDHAKSLLDLAAVKEQGRDENRRRGIELLKKTESVIPYAERWLLGDQFDPDVVAPMRWKSDIEKKESK